MSAGGFGAEYPSAEVPPPEGWTPSVVDVGAIVRQRLPVLDWADLFAVEDEGEEWILEPVLAARRMVALYSAPKVGKSLLMLELAVGIALGKRTLGTTPAPRRVLYVDFENDPRGDIKRRLEAMGYGLGDAVLLQEGLFYLSFPTMAKLDTAQGAMDLLAAVSEYGCEVVVIDTVSRSVGGEENSNDTWLAFYRNTGLALKRAGVACIRLDHAGKDAEKGMRGGSAKYGDVDAVWRLTAASETVLELLCTDHRMPLDNDRLTLVREQYPTLHHRVASGISVALDAREKEVDAVLDRLGVPLDAGRPAAAEALRQDGRKVNNQLLSKVVKVRKKRHEEEQARTVRDSSRTGARDDPSDPAVRNPPLGGADADRSGLSGTTTVRPEETDTCSVCSIDLAAADQQAQTGMCGTCELQETR